MICSRCNSQMNKNGKRNGNQRFKCPVCNYEKEVRLEINSNPSVITDKGNVLVISDLHLPAEHESALAFVCSVRDRYKCDTVIGIGDFFDMHAISFHDHDPDGYSIGNELDIVEEKVQPWIKEFPTIYQITGNHSALPYRKAMAHGLSKRMLKSYNDLFGLPDTWYWSEWYEKDDVRYQHGTGKSGKNAFIQWAVDNMQSTVSGHTHTVAGVSYAASNKKLIFGMGVGSLIDRHSYAMMYAREWGKKPILSCGVVLDDGQLPLLVPMEL